MLWGIDLGGTKIEGVVLQSATDPTVLIRKRIPTQRAHGYQHVLSQINLLVDMMAAEVSERPERIGIGTPGTLEPTTGLLKNSNTTCLNGKPLQRDLEHLLKVPVSLANDANCFALAEATLGVVKTKNIDAQVIFGIILGTGVGGGLIVDGHIVNGAQGVAGEWGHNFLDISGGTCYCGRVGCVETILSGPALEHYYFSLSGHKKTLPDIVDLHRSGKDKNASKTMNRLTSFFGKAIAMVINIVDPKVVVIGGGVGNIDEIYDEGARAAGKSVFNDKLETLFLKPELGDSAGVFGAAMLTRTSS